MRITAGEHRGRILKVPEGDAVRPTTDKVRQAIFNILKAFDLPEDAHVMDIFCGTGSLGLESISRGAVHATFIEKQRDHLRFAQDNATTMKIAGQCTFIQKEAAQIGMRAASAAPATLAFLDPPYRMNLLPPALQALHDGGWLASGAIVVCEHEKNAAVAFPAVFTLIDQRPYGDTQISFLRYQA